MHSRRVRLLRQESVVKLGRPAWSIHGANRYQALNGLDTTALISNVVSDASPTPLSNSAPPVNTAHRSVPFPTAPSIPPSAPPTTAPPARRGLATIPPTPVHRPFPKRHFGYRSLHPQGAPAAPAAAIFSLNPGSSPVLALLRVSGTLCGQTATFLIDCGASNDFVSTAFIQRHALSLAPTSRTVRGYDGKVTPSPGLLLGDLRLATADGELLSDNTVDGRAFTAAPLHGEDAILGMPWLRSIGPTMDWQRASTSVLRDGVRHTLVKAPRATSGCGSELQRLVTELYQLADEDRIDNPSRGGAAALHALLQEPGSEPVRAPVPPDPRLDPLRARSFANYADVFPDELPAGLPPSRGIEHRIELRPGSSPPARAGLRNGRQADAAIAAFVKENLAKGFIRPSQSSYAAIPFQVSKKGTDEKRTVVDFRALNGVTVPSKYPLPRMDELFDRLQGAKCFSKLDLRTGFHQIRIAEADRHKTAFRTPAGLYEYCVLAMGLCNAPGTFMQLMNETFGEFLNKFVLVFLDDIIIYSNSVEEHDAHLTQVLERLRKSKLYAKRSKCALFQTEVEFLGHYVGVNGLRVMEDKLQAVTDWPTPVCVRDVRAFLGLSGFYRRFIRDYSRTALPLSALTRTVTGAPFSWGPAEQAAFDGIKAALRSAPILLLPDPELPYVVHTDASGFATGAVLQQDQGKGLQPIAFLSKKMSDAETRYPVHEQELLSIISALQTWAHYLSGARFRVLTDHKSLIHFQTQPMLSGRQVRWLEVLSRFQFDIQYIKGPTNIVADALSRRADHHSDRSPPLDRPPQFVDSSCASRESQSSTELAQCSIFRLSDSSLAAELHAVAAGARPAAQERQAELQRQAARVRAIEAATTVVPPSPARPATNSGGSRVTPTQRCTADNKRGTQCGSRTAKGQYCWTHLRAIEGLRIKLSSVLGAGMGLFAARDIRPKAHVADYTGDKLALRRDEHGGPYCLQMHSREAIDAARTNTAPGRWANDPRGSGQPPNASFVVNTRLRTGRLIASRLICKGEEIFVSYGAAYWRQQPAAALNELATFDSPLAADIQRACLADPAYASLLGKPSAELRPPLRAVGQLLYHGDRLRIPASAELRTRLLRECHDTPLGGHLGKDKTTEQLKRRFYWPGMDADVLRYVTSCDECQRNKPSQQATPGLMMPLPIPAHAGQVWSMDLITALPRSRSGHDAIVVFVCKFSKLVHYVACLTAVSAVQLAQLFLANVVRLHGLPEGIISDRDPRFTANFWRAFWAQLGTTLHMGTAYHPQTDGQTERANRTLETMLRSRVNFAQSDWDEHLAAAELACNTAVSPTTGYSPFYLCYGRHARTPLDAAIAPLSAPDNPAATEARQAWQQALAQARTNTEAAQQRQAHHADQSRRALTFKVGDRVMLSTKHLQLLGDARRTRKLTSPYIGPYAVSRVINGNAYELQLPDTLRIHRTINITALKQYVDGNAAFPHRPPPHARPDAESHDDNGAPSYAVEAIIGKKMRNRKLHYLVRWAGYPAEEATWEPLRHLAGSAAAIADYEAGIVPPPLTARQTRARSRRSNYQLPTVAAPAP